MRTFKEPNLSNDWKCPICDTNDVEEVVLIGIAGTYGDNIQAEQIHMDCIDLVYNKEYNILYQVI